VPGQMQRQGQPGGTGANYQYIAIVVVVHQTDL
jgi:hypothetical protein